MVHGMESPKAIFASYIAYEVSDYLDVDKSEIEESILKDTKIVLKNTKVKPYVMDLGGGRCMSLTGSIDEIAFKWAWNVIHHRNKDLVDFTGAHHPSAGLVKDAAVTVSGMKLKATFAENQSLTDGAAESSTVEESGIYAYMWKQVQDVIDVLCLELVDFELTIEMPAPVLEEPQRDDSPERTLSVVIGSRSMWLESFGRDDQDNGALEQRLTIDLLVGTVRASEAGNSKSVEYPLMDPFSYSTRIIRVDGTRFEGLFTGLNVIGQSIASAFESVLSTGTENGIVIHAGVVQTQALVQLYGLLTSSESSDTDSTLVAASNNALSTNVNENHQSNEKVTPQPPANSGTNETPSFFKIPITSVTIVNMDESTIIAGFLNVTYKADDTALNLDVGSFERTINPSAGSDPNDLSVSVAVSGIHFHTYPTMKLVVDSVDFLDLPGAFELTKELSHSTVIFEGGTLCIKLVCMEATMLESENEAKEQEGKKPLQQKKHSSGTKPTRHRRLFSRRNYSKKTRDTDDTKNAREDSLVKQDLDVYSIFPFSVTISIQDVSLKSESGGSIMLFGDLNLDTKPGHSSVGSGVHFRVGHFKSDLLRLEGTSVSAFIRRDEPEIVHDFKFEARDMRVTSGYSLQQWYETLETILNFHYYLLMIKPPDEWQIPAKKKTLKIPFAEIAPLNIRISFKGTGVEMKETTVAVDSFHGNSKTTLKDMILYITEAIVRRVPHFVSNWEVLDINVLRQGVAMTSADAISDAIDVADAAAGGAGAGVALGVGAVAAIDAAEATINLGKKSRGATPEQQYRLGDITRGLIHAPEALAQKGARRRGSKGEKSFKTNAAVGAICGAEQYVVHNAKELTIAGVGGIGVIIGTAIGGPLGGIVIGISASLGTAVTIDAVKYVRKKAAQKMDEDLSKADLSSSTKK